MNKPVITFCLLMPCIFFFFSGWAQVRHETEAMLAAQKTKNSKELIKAINHYKERPDNKKKLEALCFLIANMDIHTSFNYYWADGNGKRIQFNELDYATFEGSVRALDSVSKLHGKLHPVKVIYRDIDTVKADYLINNIEKAFTAWESKPSYRNLSFDDFCEYVLPYRISNEPVQPWRNEYFDRFQWINDSIGSGMAVDRTGKLLSENYKTWFFNSYKIEGRKEPLPRLGGLQLLHRKKGPCEDIADMSVFALRSQGFPASIDEVPAWATSSGKHFLNVVFTPESKAVSFDASTDLETEKKLNREPAKVIRVTYSKQKDVIAATEPVDSIPPGFLRTLNYKDVTNEYWETRDVSFDLFKSKTKHGMVYACAFNFSAWKPVWWGKVQGKSAVVKNLCKGAVFLPVYYEKGKLKPAGYPVASGYNNTLVLKADTSNKRSIHVEVEERYLAFRPGKSYKLFYWTNGWRLLGEKKAGASTKELVFDGVPSNALLLLRPEYSQNKERPFIITADGKRLWW